MSHKNRIYTSDLTDSQWELIKPLLPLEREGPGRPLELDLRAVLNGLQAIDNSQSSEFVING